MSQDDVNDQFRAMMFTNAVQETDEIINQVVLCEAKARHTMACEGDPEAAHVHANAAYAVLMETSLKSLPSVVMGIADLFNREHEAYTLVLDHIQDAQEHFRQFHVFRERGDTAMSLASLAAVEQILAQAMESAIYEKDDSA